MPDFLLRNEPFPSSMTKSKKKIAYLIHLPSHVPSKPGGGREKNTFSATPIFWSFFVFCLIDCEIFLFFIYMLQGNGTLIPPFFSTVSTMHHKPPAVIIISLPVHRIHSGVACNPYISSNIGNLVIRYLYIGHHLSSININL